MKTGNFTLDKIGVDDDCLERVLRYEGTPGIIVERKNFALCDDKIQKEANYLSILFGKYTNTPMPSIGVDPDTMELFDKRDLQDKCYSFKKNGLSIENRFVQDEEKGTFAQYIGIKLEQFLRETCVQYFQHIVRVSYERGDKPVKAVVDTDFERGDTLFRERVREERLWEKAENDQNIKGLANVLRMNTEIREAVHTLYERALRDPAYFEKAKKLPVQGLKWK